MEPWIMRDRPFQLVLFFLAVCFYLSTVSHGFVYDDLVHIVNNPDTRSWSGLWAAFTEPLFPGNLYRPLVIASYVVTYQLVGFSEGLYHLTNIVAHALVVVVLFRLLTCVVSREMSVMIALVFAIHPLHTETVANITGRAELFAAFFTLLALHALLSYVRKESCSFVPPLFFFFMALLCKESAIVTVPLGALLLFSRHPTEEERPRLFQGLSMLVVPFLAYLVLRVNAVGSVFGSSEIDFVDNPIAGIPFHERVFNGLVYLAQYAELVFVPSELSADYSYAHRKSFTDIFAIEVLAPVAGLFLLVALGVAGLRHRKDYGFFILWFFLAFLVTANILFPIGTVFAERLAYFPSVGLVGLLAVMFSVLENKKVRNGLFGALLFVLAGQGLLYQQYWKSNDTLFTRQARVSPRSVKTKVNYAAVLRNQGKSVQARRELSEALKIVPDYPDALFAQATLSIAERDYGQAAEWLRRALAAHPDHIPALNALARISLNNGRIDHARLLLRRVVVQSPKDLKAHAALLAVAIQQRDKVAVERERRTLERLGGVSSEVERLLQQWDDVRKN